MKIVTIEKGIENNAVKINIDLTNLTEIQSNILWKYEKQVDMNLVETNCTVKKFVDRLDHYILHAIEEIVEARDENGPINMQALQSHQKRTRLLKEEMIDIILYLGTMRALLRFNLHNMKMKYVIDKPVEVQTRIFVAEDREFLPEHFDPMMADVTGHMMSLRMLFPERKWHKPYEDPTVDELYYRLLRGIDYIDYAICDVFGVLSSFVTDEDLNDTILKKNGFVMGLKKLENGEVIE